MVTKQLLISRICSVKWLPFIQLLRQVQWLSMLTNGLQQDVKTFLVKLFLFRKCNLRVVQLVLCMALSKLVH